MKPRSTARTGDPTAKTGSLTQQQQRVEPRSTEKKASNMPLNLTYPWKNQQASRMLFPMLEHPYKINGEEYHVGQV